MRRRAARAVKSHDWPRGSGRDSCPPCLEGMGLHWLAGDRGFEPRLADPESAVLPLDESPTQVDYSIRIYDEQVRLPYLGGGSGRPLSSPRECLGVRRWPQGSLSTFRAMLPPARSSGGGGEAALAVSWRCTPAYSSCRPPDARSGRRGAKAAAASPGSARSPGDWGTPSIPGGTAGRGGHRPHAGPAHGRRATRSSPPCPGPVPYRWRQRPLRGRGRLSLGVAHHPRSVPLPGPASGPLSG